MVITLPLEKARANIWHGPSDMASLSLKEIHMWALLEDVPITLYVINHRRLLFDEWLHWVASVISVFFASAVASFQTLTLFELWRDVSSQIADDSSCIFCSIWLFFQNAFVLNLYLLWRESRCFFTAGLYPPVARRANTRVGNVSCRIGETCFHPRKTPYMWVIRCLIVFGRASSLSVCVLWLDLSKKCINSHVQCVIKSDCATLFLHINKINKKTRFVGNA